MSVSTRSGRSVAALADELTTESEIPSESPAPDEPAYLRAAAGCTILEGQLWWSATRNIPLGGESEHVYVQVIDGKYTFTLVSRLHNVPGWYLRNVCVQAASDQDENGTLANVSRTDVGCLIRDCTFSTSVTVDLSFGPARDVRRRPFPVARRRQEAGTRKRICRCEDTSTPASWTRSIRLPSPAPGVRTFGRGDECGVGYWYMGPCGFPLFL